MSGFVRRYGSPQTLAVLSQIEGVVIIDNPSAAEIAGVGTGTAALLGEFPDVTYAVNVDASGNVTTKYQPIEIFGPTDQENKLGGWDETIGDFGGSCGNGFVELANKRFSRLIVVPLNLASSKGVRVWRKLPTNKSATDPSPAQPIQGAAVKAGYEFRDTNNRVRLAKRVSFSGTPAFHQNTNGAVTSSAPAAARPFTGSGFDTALRPDGTRGVLKGDIVVIGVTSGAGALGANADTYRVNAVTSATVLSLEKMDGSSFDWTTTTNLPWRIHTPDVADSGGATNATEAAGYLIPARPLDASVSTSVTIVPTVDPPAIAADSSDPLSGLRARTQSVTGLTYTAAVQGANPAAGALLDAEYTAMAQSLLGDDLPQREVNLAWAARTSATIRSQLRIVALQRKANGLGLVVAVSPELTSVTPTAWLGDASPGVGATRAQEVIYNVPGVQSFVRQAAGLAVKGADGLTHTDGNLDMMSAGWAISDLSQLAAYRNIGQASDPIKTANAPILGYQRGVDTRLLEIGYYTLAKSRGVCSIRMDRAAGAIFQSDVTSSLTPGEQLIRRRRMSFFIQDSIATALLPFSKELLTERLQTDIIGAHVDFFETLLSRNNPRAAAIRGYVLDTTSGNTEEGLAAGVFVVIHRVEMLPTADVIVIQSDVGYNVLSVQELQAA